MIHTKRLLPLKGVTPVHCFIRHISFDKLSGKKVTRLESDVELKDCEFKGRLINRNPRNPELSAQEHKPTGFWLDKDPPTDWNTIEFEHADDKLMAYLKHWSGRKLVTVSTDEPQLKKYFRKPNTRQAAILLGKVLSKRCLLSGYLCAGTRGSIDNQSPRTRAFYDSITSEGFTLKEPSEIEPRSNTDL